jgi:hypothetical protein
LKANGAEHLPLAVDIRNSAWLQLAALATTLTAWVRHLGFKETDLATAETKTLRCRIFNAPARLATHARRRLLLFPPDWAWTPPIITAYTNIHAIPQRT